MDRRKYQVSGERRLYGDLRSFSIADFSHHDLVGVVPQNRSQSAGKCQALFLIDRNLCDAANLVLDRVLNGDDLVFLGLNLVHTRIQRCSLAAPGGSCHQHHAVRLVDVAAEFTQIVFVKSNYVESQ